MRALASARNRIAQRSIVQSSMTITAQLPSELLDAVDAAFPKRRIDGDHAFAQWGHTYPNAPSYGAHVDGKTWAELDSAYIVRRTDAMAFLSTRELIDVLAVYLRSLIQDGWWSPVATMLPLIVAKPR